jgi:hypothetical protein
MLSVEKTQSKRQYKEDNGYKIYPIILKAAQILRELQEKNRLYYFPILKQRFIFIERCDFFSCRA